MKTINLTLFVLSAILLAVPAMCDWNISFGESESQVSFSAPKGAEDFPMGPNSFRMINDDLWVLDSVGGRLLSFDKNGKLTEKIKIPGLGKEFYLDDFAAQIDNGKIVSFWVAERFANVLTRVSRDGKELAKAASESLAQLDELAVDSKGQLYVGDYGKSQLAVFSNEGQFLRAIPWQLSGFAVDQADNLHMINFVSGSGHQHLALNSEGKELFRTDIGLSDMQNPRLWKVGENDSIIISFIPQTGNPTKNVLFSIAKDGTIVKKLDYKNPYYIARYLVLGEKKCWVVDADYLKAPKKGIELKQVGNF